MLDVDTKRRIDTARDILVGKVPDPKSQVEQITIALIYKFMDDMDQQSINMGGKASFFTGEYAKYAWSNIFNPRLGGFEMLALYADAITRMSLNPNLPQIFRDIFKNAFLPYRDPETLKLFLRTINDFSYEHSERLGDAFEYLLSVLGSQGDAGQFRTPRHIIDFIVKVIKPQKHETILDPACGTAGFLISAYKYILDCNKKNYPGDLLNPDERKKLLNNFKGYDISPDMGLLSRVNMFLHGFQQPQIFEYDTLTSEERWNEYVDVILANPPFMTPKGGIRPHKRFSVQSNRSEVLFVDYIAEHLTPNGRAAIIVPEGIVFQTAGAYKQLRKYLVEKNLLWAVVSLPSGVFNPYAGVKTSILFLDRFLAKKTEKILFVKVEKDGFDLGAQRRPIEQNDLPVVQALLATWQQAAREDNLIDIDATKQTVSTLLVSKSRLGENGDYNLSAERYRSIGKTIHQKWNFAPLGEVCFINPKKSQIGNLDENTLVSFVPMEDLGEHRISFTPKKERRLGEVIKGYTYFQENDVLLAKVTPCFENGKSGIARNLKNGLGFGSSEFLVIRASEQVLPEYVYWIISHNNFIEIGKKQMIGTGGLQRIPLDFVSTYQIPLPPLEIQRKIVDEIAEYQCIIDGAHQIVERWEPDITHELNDALPKSAISWPMNKIGDVCEFIDYRGKTPNKSSSGIRLITAKNVKMGMLVDEPKEFIPSDDYDSWMTRGFPQKNDVLFTTEGPLGNVAVLNTDEKVAVGQRIITLHCLSCINPIYLANILRSREIQEEIQKRSTGSTVKGILAKYFREILIPLPPLDVQETIVAHIEHERQIIESNRELIRIYEEKIQKVIERVWEG